MENSLSVPSTSIAQCAVCFTNVVDDDVYCANCGYPLKGTEEEQKYFILKRDMADIDIASFNKRLKRAGNTLYYLAGGFVFISFILFFSNKDNSDVAALVIPNLVLAIVFVALGGYSRVKPLACIVSGLALYIIVLTLMVINNPVNVASGIIFKIFIIGYLIKGIKSAIEIEKIKKEHNIA